MKENTEIKKRILDLVLAGNYQPLKPRAIAKKLKLVEEEKQVRRSIKQLVREKKIAFAANHMVTKPKAKNQKAHKPGLAAVQHSTPDIELEPSPKASKRTAGIKAKAKTKPDSKRKPKPASDRPKASKTTKSNEVIGTFRKAAGGFGFVTPEDSTATDRSEDIFIPKTKTLDAAHLDTVLVRVSRGRSASGRDKRKKVQHNRMSGRIIKVIQRKTHQFVGSYCVSGDDGFVVVDGGTFDSSIMVGDASAKNCKVGDKVVVEMVHFPTANSVGEGVIVEVLGDRGTPGVDTLMIIREFGLPEDFPEEVLDDARKQADLFDEAIKDGRTDFTNTTVATIDPKTARDFDDAISLEKIENGHWKLGVHIADVSHFVPYRSDLDNEAFARGTSVYLPDRVIPMLPEIISNNLASLQPDRVRYTMTAIIEFNAEGVPIATDLHRGAIKSAHRFNYEEIDDYLENDKPWKKKLTPEVFELVRNMHTLAMTLRKRRMDNGSINLVLPEVVIDLDDDGRVSGAHTTENTESHQVIEEFMLAANEAVAQYLVDEKLYLLRRIHEQPSEAKLTELTQFVKQLGIDCGSLQDRFELKRVVEDTEHLPQSYAIHFAILRSMQKAIYSPKEAGHFALASEAYCHFTSPIRRYPDLVIHRMVGDLIDGKRPPADFDRLSATGKHCSDLEKRAADAERELKKLKLLSFMEKRVGETLTAIVTGVEAFGIFAQGVEIPAEGLVPVSKLPPDKYQFDRPSKTLNGFRSQNQFRLGDRVEVQVDLVDLDKRIMEFKLIRTLDQVSPTAIPKGKVKTKTKPKSKAKPKRKSKSKPKDKAAEKGKAKPKGDKTKAVKPKPKRAKDKLKAKDKKGAKKKPKKKKPKS
jgi:ribonuclease R